MIVCSMIWCSLLLPLLLLTPLQNLRPVVSEQWLQAQQPGGDTAGSSTCLRHDMQHDSAEGLQQGEVVRESRSLCKHHSCSSQAPPVLPILKADHDQLQLASARADSETDSVKEPRSRQAFHAPQPSPLDRSGFERR